MAKQRNILRLDTSGFEEMLKKLEQIGGDAQKIAEEALLAAAERIQTDTHLALSNQYLPAAGKYWTGKTSESVISDAQVTWQGGVGSIPVGFDFSKPGAGGYLISGTPRMRPDTMLNKMYKQKAYMNEIKSEMKDKVLTAVVREMEKSQ